MSAAPGHAAHELTHVLQDQHFDLEHLREQADATPNADPDAPLTRSLKVTRFASRTTTWRS